MMEEGPSYLACLPLFPLQWGPTRKCKLMREEKHLLKHKVQTVAKTHDFIVWVMMFIVFLKAPFPGAEYLGFNFSLPCVKTKTNKFIQALMNLEKLEYTSWDCLIVPKPRSQWKRIQNTLILPISKPVSEFMCLLLHDSPFLHDWQDCNGI